MSSVRNFMKVTSIYALLLVGVHNYPAKATEPAATISGKITNARKKPVSGIPVLLYDEKMRQIASDQSEADGDFSLPHKECESCTLVVNPPQAMSLASARVEKIPGNANRNVVVQLQHGFLVTGRVVHDGKGLKGMVLRALPNTNESESEHAMHQGGVCKTGWTGSFSMVLTPGPKKIYVVNDRRDDLAKQTEYSFDVTSDTALPDIVVPVKD